jgi:hypothetical protein
MKYFHRFNNLFRRKYKKLYYNNSKEPEKIGDFLAGECPLYYCKMFYKIGFLRKI